jgi:hypothetical protein
MRLLDNSRSKVKKDDLDRRMPPIVPSLLWVLLWLTMWFWAIAGPLCVVLGVLAQLIDLPDWLFSFPKGKSLVTVGFLGVIGISFVWLRLRGYIKFSGE